MRKIQSRLSNPLKIISLLVLGGVLLLIFIGLHKRLRPVPAVSAQPDQPLSTFMLPDNYSFRQDDDRWASETIGMTEDTLGSYGCTIASVAMSVSNLTQSDITPQTLESKLSAANGFTDRGWLIWDKVQLATDNRVRAKYYDTPRHKDIKTCMEARNYPVIKIKLYDSIIHWVMIVGTTEDEYLIRDPLVGGATDKPIELSNRSHDIYGVRCIMLID